MNLAADAQRHRENRLYFDRAFADRGLRQALAFRDVCHEHRPAPVSNTRPTIRALDRITLRRKLAGRLRRDIRA